MDRLDESLRRAINAVEFYNRAAFMVSDASGVLHTSIWQELSAWPIETKVVDDDHRSLLLQAAIQRGGIATAAGESAASFHELAEILARKVTWWLPRDVEAAWREIPAAARQNKFPQCDRSFLLANLRHESAIASQLAPPQQVISDGSVHIDDLVAASVGGKKNLQNALCGLGDGKGNYQYLAARAAIIAAKVSGAEVRLPEDFREFAKCLAGESAA